MSPVSCCLPIKCPKSASPKSSHNERHRACHPPVHSPDITYCGLPFASLARIGGCVRTLRAEELAGDVKGLASHNDDLLAVKELLGDGAGEATEQVALAVDDLNGLSARRPMEYSWCCGKRGMASRRPENLRQR
jgi:hypothetical protein